MVSRRSSLAAATLMISPSSALAPVRTSPTLPTAAHQLRHLRGGGAARMAVAEANPLLQQDSLPRFGGISAADVKPAMSSLLESLETDFEAFENKLESALADGSAAYPEVVEALEKIEGFVLNSLTHHALPYVTLPCFPYITSIHLEEVLNSLTHTPCIPICHTLAILTHISPGIIFSPQAPVEYAWGVVGHLMGVQNSEELRSAHEEMQPAVVKTTTRLGQVEFPILTHKSVAHSTTKKCRPTMCLPKSQDQNRTICFDSPLTVCDGLSCGRGAERRQELL